LVGPRTAVTLRAAGMKRELDTQSTRLQGLRFIGSSRLRGPQDTGRVRLFRCRVWQRVFNQFERSGNKVRPNRGLERDSYFVPGGFTANRALFTGYPQPVDPFRPQTATAGHQRNLWRGNQREPSVSLVECETERGVKVAEKPRTDHGRISCRSTFSFCSKAN
jgi:hypothetical protein